MPKSENQQLPAEININQQEQSAPAAGKSKRPPEEESKLVSFVMEQRDKCQKDAYEMQGYLNISYFAGKQWVTYDKVRSTIIEPSKESWQIRYVANKIQPIVRTEMAKITKNKFVMFVAPATNEDSDVKSARIAEKVMDWLEYDLGLQGKDREACLWGLTTGIGFMKCYWNDSKGTKLEDGVYEGDVCADVVSMFELKWDTTFSKWDDLPWIMHEKIRTVDDIKKMYGVEVPEEQGLILTNLYEAKLQTLNNISEGLSYKQAEKSAKVVEYWEKPSVEYEQGRRITVAGDKLLFYDEDIGFGEQDDTERELPFFPFLHIQVPGRLIPTCIVEQLIPIQREYNKSRSQIIENKNLMGNPIWIVPTGSMEDLPTNEPGAVYEYLPGQNGRGPEMVTPPSMTADVYKNLDYCDGEFEFVSGQHETSHGQTPTGVTSGVAIGYLQEQDDTKLSPTIANYIDFKKRYMRYLLKMVQKKYDVPRTLRLVGADKTTDTMQFKGSDLTSIDVRVQEGTMYQKSRAALQDWIIKLAQYGILDPVKDKQMILKALELGITEDVYDFYQIDVDQAQGENSKWQNGDMSPDVQEYYKHDVHVGEHNRFRKGDIYRQLPDETKAIIDAHINQHLMYVMQSVIPQNPVIAEPNKQPGIKSNIPKQNGGINAGSQM